MAIPICKQVPGYHLSNQLFDGYRTSSLMIILKTEQYDLPLKLNVVD